MRSQDKTKDYLLKELIQLKNEIIGLKKAENEHKKTSDDLRQERGLYFDLANALPSGIYRLRVFPEDGLLEEKWLSINNAPYIVEFVNDRFCEILNLDKLVFEINPGIINDFICDADKKEFVKRNVEANSNTTPFEWEGRFLVKGQLIWVHFESVPRQLESGDIIWTGTLNDVSERIKTEQEIKSKNQELQKLIAEKDKFFSIIAHDLKSPFNSIIGFSEVLIEQVEKEDLESIKEYADIIRNSSKRAMNLLSNLMQWSQSQTGRMDFTPGYFEMEDIINEIVLLFTDIAAQKSITITKKLPSRMLVYADKAMISTILRNLISNALKFSNQGGRINISAEVKQNQVTISVTDTGVGMAKSVIEKIFRIDTKYSTPGTQNEMGTGLGLILCKEFIEKHNGNINIESEPGKGSKFHFTIPLSASPDIKTVSHIEAKQANGNMVTSLTL